MYGDHHKNRNMICSFSTRSEQKWSQNEYMINLSNSRKTVKQKAKKRDNEPTNTKHKRTEINSNVSVTVRNVSKLHCPMKSYRLKLD